MEWRATVRLVLVLPLLAAACVAPTQAPLNQAVQDCSYGNQYACQAVPGLNAQVQQENYNNQVAGGIAAAAVGAAVVGGAVAASDSNHGYYGRGYYPGYGRGYYRPYRGW